jgi:3-isopropylmalate/(R)-2-methylmalate dehydratase large subunit
MPLSDRTTLFDKIWNRHVVSDLGGGLALLHVDRHILHDLNGRGALSQLRAQGHAIRNPELTIATTDHAVSTEPGRGADTNPKARDLLAGLKAETQAAGIRLFGINDDGQGIVHVIGPELGFTLPGSLLVCGDSHTCTQGALGALTFAVGRSEVMHILATQTIYQRRPRTMRVWFEGAVAPGVTAKDLVLALIGKIGASGGAGHAVEYAGSVIRALPIEARMTICNLSIELGAKFGMIAPDEATFTYLQGRPFAPRGELWDDAVRSWSSLRTNDDAVFDREVEIDANTIAPHVTWGTSPQDVVPVDGRIPDPSSVSTAERKAAMAAALDYMGLTPGEPIAGTPIDWVFIGSCTNSRISDLRSAAAIAKGNRMASGIRAWVVPGSQRVKREAEAEGLDRVFKAAGFEWREPGCSMCLAANGETVPPGKRSVSTSNRNFEGRQGPRARTHLASPATAAACAIAGRIADVRKLAVVGHG